MKSRIFNTLSLIAAILLVCTIISWPIVQWIHYEKTFPARHLEATQFIEAVYGYYVDKGEWPDAATANSLSALSARWEYLEKTEPADPKTTPLLLLDGDYHLRLAYYFSPPNGEKINGEWRGSSGTFEAEVQYHATSRKQP